MNNDSSRRTFIATTISSFMWMFTSSPVSAAAPAISAGSPCQVKGREKTVNGVTYICRNAKGKLVWRRSPLVSQEQIITVRVLESAALEIGKTSIVSVPLPTGGSSGVVVTRTDAGITALSVNCTHAGFPVARVGKLLECELHGSQFDPTTGSVITGPASRSLLRYDATESNGGIYVTIRSY